jgi:hypothetical protein
MYLFSYMSMEFCGPEVEPQMGIELVKICWLFWLIVCVLMPGR